MESVQGQAEEYRYIDIIVLVVVITKQNLAHKYWLISCDKYVKVKKAGVKQVNYIVVLSVFSKPIKSFSKRSVL